MIARIDTPSFASSVSSEKTEAFSANLNDYANSDYCYEDVAVVGMACRVAGKNDSPEQLWDFMMRKGDGSGEIPDLRWEPYQRRDPRNAKELSKTTSRGYFLDKLENFDSSFFGISPREAEMMDPQQRVSLEVTWEALENAGIAPQSLAGSNTAVFMGVNSDDYSKLLLEDLPNVEAWMGIGTAYCGIPNRISYQLDLMGPSTAVDTACASSLVAIHHGRQALLQGECDVAIVGGVNALCGPGLTRVLDKAGAISPEGRCHSFDDNAKGYGRGEGAGVIILKRSEDARMNDDRILAILKGSAVGQDGRTNGIMAPNGKAQELVARKALEVAKIHPKSIQYVEAHATSTPIGDPTEIAAMANVYGKGRMKDHPCYIGSIKPNIGHLEAGAGVMGFIKAVLAVNKGKIPPQANLQKLNSKIQWDKSGIQVVQNAMDWPESNFPKRAAICSYGYGGTVSHAVIEEYIGDKDVTNDAVNDQTEDIDKYQVLLLSAPQEKRLTSQATLQHQWIVGDGKDYDLESIATTLATRRNHHDYRAAMVVDDLENAADSLQAFANGKTYPWTISTKVVDPEARDKAIWVFSGHGAQWKEMGQGLIHNPVFYNTVTSLDHIVSSEMGFSAVRALETGDFDSSERVQVMTYVMQIGLTAVLKSYGCFPQAVMGHSVGEIAASVVGGALTAEEGAIIVCRRARLYRGVMGQGSMVLVNSPYMEVQRQLQGRQDITAAIDSSPTSCVVSGETNAVNEFSNTRRERGEKVLTVKTDIAFHSPLLDKLVGPLRQSLLKILKPKSPQIKIYSTSLSDPRGNSPRDIQYWTDNMTRPVLLTQATNAAIDDGFRIFLEISSHPLVSHSINETLIEAGVEDYTVIPTLVRKKPAEKSLLYSLAQLHCKGVSVSWKMRMPGKWACDMPNTSWKHQKIWRNIETGPYSTETTHDIEKHTLLGQRTSVAGENMVVYTTKLDQNTKPFPGNHPLHGTEIIPAAVLLNTFLHGTKLNALSNIVLRVPVAISAPRDLQVVVKHNHVILSSKLSQSPDQGSDDAAWLTHTTGQIAKESLAFKEYSEVNLDISAIKARIGNQLKNNFSIEYLDGVGVSAMGFPWAVMEHFGNEKEMIAKVDAAPSVLPGSPLPWDPQSWAPILDAATSIGSTLFFTVPRLRMPAQIDRVTIRNNVISPPKVCYIHVREATGIDLAVHINVTDENGYSIAKFQTMRFSEIEGTPGVSGSVESLVHQLSWPPASLAETPLSLGHAVFISRDSSISRYAETLNPHVQSVSKFLSAQEFAGSSASRYGNKSNTIIFVPERVNSSPDIAEASERFCSQLIDIVKSVAAFPVPFKVFAITESVSKGETPTALAQAPLHGLSRIIASEEPDLWGGLIDIEDSAFPLQALKYVQGGDVIRVSDSVARIARLRAMPREKLLPAAQPSNLSPRPEGTYLISGGLGALGLEVADYLVANSARRLVLLSRRALPPRREWGDVEGPGVEVIQRIQRLENLGTTVHVVSVNLGAEGSEKNLQAALDRLALPPISGVVHAAGVLEDQLILQSTADSFKRVLAPKIAGALALHQLFPVKSLDFFVLFSSCGQLFGFPGQGSYASGNAFLDTLAIHRRNHGDNSVAFQWTSWRGMGMAASTDFINAELESKGITDVTRDEAFRAWDHVAKYDVDHAVVLRSMAFDEGEPLPVPILTDIAIRRAAAASTAPAGTTATNNTNADIPKSGPELKAYLETKIRECVAKVLQLASIDDVEPRVALSNLGMDSVMTVGLRRSLQQILHVKVPPTLTWSHPTVTHLAGWFAEKMAG